MIIVAIYLLLALSLLGAYSYCDGRTRRQMAALFINRNCSFNVVEIAYHCNKGSAGLIRATLRDWVERGYISECISNFCEMPFYDLTYDGAIILGSMYGIDDYYKRAAHVAELKIMNDPCDDQPIRNLEDDLTPQQLQQVKDTIDRMRLVHNQARHTAPPAG